MNWSKIIECVPNFSEGRDLEKIDKIVAPFRGKSGVKLLDYSNDEDHNRLVVTLVGEPEALRDAVIEAIGIAVRLIDLNHHSGQHPRMGAVDVVPFIPIKNTTMEEAVKELEDLYKRSFNVPVKDIVGPNPELVYAYRTQKMLRVALTVACGALNRKESRGAHYREDYSRRDDVNWLNRTIATWKEGDTLPTLSYQNLDISKMELPPGFRGYGVKNYIENPESVKRQAEVDAIRAKMEAEGADRFAIQNALMPYEHLLPKRLKGKNERIDEPLND